MFSHRFHRFSQMVRVWNSVYSVGLPTPPVNLCKSVQSVGGLFSTLLQNSLAEIFSYRFHRFSQMMCVWSSVNSVNSVGPPTPPSESVKICEICGRIILSAWVIALLVHFCLVDALLALASGKAERRQVTSYRATKAEGFTPRSR